MTPPPIPPRRVTVHLVQRVTHEQRAVHLLPRGCGCGREFIAVDATTECNVCRRVLAEAAQHREAARG